ncbi:uncharacterized protein BJ171DRAFT_505791 [Polychytrium aggregatum]|uniref:uncharacterized protein n=1 Tax=Polychytrium aggregatum TaxID=110093 RepID=UPI0022FED5D7|nr:uncharacterized protein BJ171DRAFT_505791 [Polychytrium aggregatum]KAI9204412.1 hypothetical protein BJ171DRAFT_505791 [Polychytrium aggregatum]
MRASAQTMAEPSPVQEDLARFDLLTILITNEAFIHAASPPLLAKLLRVSNQTRAILNTYQIWERLLSPNSQITPEFLFEGVDPSIDQLKVTQGLLCYTLRRNQHMPISSSILEKENELWSEVYRDRQLFNRVFRYCQVTDPEFHFPENAKPNGLKELSVEGLITIAEKQYFEFQWPISVGFWYGATIRPSQRMDRYIYVSKLLPFDISGINGAKEQKLTLEDVSFLEVSGWPKTLSDISNLAIRHNYRERVTDPLISLEGMPKELPRLTTLDLSGCSRLKSLKGVSEMPELVALLLPSSIESLEGMPKVMPMLATLDLSRCSQLTSLKGMPVMPNLEELLLPPSIEPLEDIPKVLPTLTRPSMSRCGQLKSLEEISEMPRFEILQLLESTES